MDKEKSAVEKLNNYLNGNSEPAAVPYWLSSEAMEKARNQLNEYINGEILGITDNIGDPILYSENIPKNEIALALPHSYITIKGRKFYFNMAWIDRDVILHPILKDLSDSELDFIKGRKYHRKKRKKK